MYQTDVLKIVGILTRLGCCDDRMRAALEVVASKRDPQGRWKLEASFNDRLLVPVEQKGQPSKWVTLKAVVMFSQCRSILESRSGPVPARANAPSPSSPCPAPS